MNFKVFKQPPLFLDIVSGIRSFGVFLNYKEKSFILAYGSGSRIRLYFLLLRPFYPLCYFTTACGQTSQEMINKTWPHAGDPQLIKIRWCILITIPGCTGDLEAACSSVDWIHWKKSFSNFLPGIVGVKCLFFPRLATEFEISSKRNHTSGQLFSGHRHTEQLGQEKMERKWNHKKSLFKNLRFYWIGHLLFH
jgi:hypothetical protein